MYKKTPTTSTGDYDRWLADEDTDLTDPPGSASKPKLAQKTRAGLKAVQQLTEPPNKQIEPQQPEPQSSIPSMLQKKRADLKAVRQQLDEPPNIQTEGLARASAQRHRRTHSRERHHKKADRAATQHPKAAHHKKADRAATQHPKAAHRDPQRSDRGAGMVSMPSPTSDRGAGMVSMPSPTSPHIDSWPWSIKPQNQSIHTKQILMPHIASRIPPHQTDPDASYCLSDTSPINQRAPQEARN